MVTPGDGAIWVEVIGHYDDELVRIDEGWRINRRVTTYAADDHRWPPGSRGGQRA